MMPALVLAAKMAPASLSRSARPREAPMGDRALRDLESAALVYQTSVIAVSKHMWYQSCKHSNSGLWTDFERELYLL